MRASDWISVLFLTLFIFLAIIRKLSARKRFNVIGLGIFGILLVWIGTIVPVFRNWIPALIMLVVYWQGGSFFSQTNEKLQRFLEAFDEKFFPFFPIRFQAYWEVAYFFCYPLVPAAVATLHGLHLQSKADFFWAIVLPPTFLCHLVVSFYQTQPPWVILNLQPSGFLRKINFIVIRHASIQINTFPSAHVAASIAVALAMLHLHLIAGLVFSFFALSITGATVVGRYHYAADAVLGFFLALCWYFIAVLLYRS
jgi:PAP2 superfamily